MNDFELSKEAVNKMSLRGIPDRMQGALIRYYNKRIPPGDFLIALLSNDLMQTFARADDENRYCVHAYLMWLYNDVPGGAGFGNLQAVDTWLKGDHSLQGNRE